MEVKFLVKTTYRKDNSTQWAILYASGLVDDLERAYMAEINAEVTAYYLPDDGEPVKADIHMERVGSGMRYAVTVPGGMEFHSKVFTD